MKSLHGFFLCFPKSSPTGDQYGSYAAATIAMPARLEIAPDGQIPLSGIGRPRDERRHFGLRPLRKMPPGSWLYPKETP
jgi:hypothetical protein